MSAVWSWAAAPVISLQFKHVLQFPVFVEFTHDGFSDPVPDLCMVKVVLAYNKNPKSKYVPPFETRYFIC